MRRRVVIWSTAAIAAVALVLFVVPWFVPWTPLNCRHEEVDIRSGRLRFSRYLLFCKVAERIEDSALTRALPADAIGPGAPVWHRVNTYSPGVHYSPHYIFHGAIAQIEILTEIWALAKQNGFLEEVKQRTARDVLALWQYAGNDSLAREYIGALEELRDKSKRQQILAALPTLRNPLVEANGSEVVNTVFFPNAQAMERVRGFLSPSGEFIRHGVWERWWPDGTRESYGHFENGEHHGRRFEWNRDGKLIVIEAFDRGQLSEYACENLEQHSDYRVAQELVAEDRRKARP
ncbi:MAG TPA: hypothetical protein VGP72_09250 [Planctomycetota bacterium]|jgi:hypothetical protein